MKPLHGKNPQDIVQILAQYVKAMVEFLFWAIIAAGSLTATYVSARIIIVAARAILKAVGI